MWGRRFGASVFAVAMVMALGACSGDDDEPSAATPAEDVGTETPSDADGTESPADGGGSGGESTGSATATMTVGSTVYEFTESTACGPAGGALFVSFDAGADHMELTSTGDVVLVRARLGGEEWVDTGSAPEPEVDGSKVTWTGEMGTREQQEQVTIEANC